MADNKCEITEPVVSVVCLTYNHESYIRQALDSFLMQQTTFPYEIIIADDCSTDGTESLCGEYAIKNPQVVRYLRAENNVGCIENERMAIEQARGTYIAVCEGDDYWTDPLKLQKQVDFLESHPDYSVTWARYQKYIQSKDMYMSDGNENLFKDGQDSVEITTHMFLHRWITQYLTMMFRHSAYDNTWCTRYKHFRDSHQFYHLLQNGKGALLNFEGGMYRQTGEGIYSDLDHINRQKIQIEVFKELWKVNDDDDAKSMYERNVRYLLEQMRNAKTPKREQYKYAWRLFAASQDLKGLFSNVQKILKQ